MKKKKLTKPIFALALLFAALWWGGCRVEESTCDGKTVLRSLSQEDTLAFAYQAQRTYWFELKKGDDLDTTHFSISSISLILDTTITSGPYVCDTLINELYKCVSHQKISNRLNIYVEPNKIHCDFFNEKYYFLVGDYIGILNGKSYSNTRYFDSINIEGQLFKNVFNELSISGSDTSEIYYSNDFGFISISDPKTEFSLKLIKI